MHRSVDDAAWGPEHVYRSERGELRMWLAAPTVMVLKYVGHSDAACVDFIAQVLAVTVGHGRGLQFYIDCEEQTGYDAAFRERIVEWQKRVQPDTRCILVRSRFVAFGVAIANALVGTDPMTVTCRETFRAQLATAVSVSLAASSAAR